MYAEPVPFLPTPYRLSIVLPSSTEDDDPVDDEEWIAAWRDATDTNGRAAVITAWLKTECLDGRSIVEFIDHPDGSGLTPSEIRDLLSATRA